MSRFSGKCDLYDHISGMGGWYDKAGNHVTFGQNDVNVYYSDDVKDFEAFKKATNGIIYQHRLVEVSDCNLNEVKKYCKFFDYKEENGKTIYIYWDKEYTSLKKLNKQGVYVEMPIYFNTILDLVPYYPYLVAVCGAQDGIQHVVISNESYVDKQYKSFLSHGIVSNDSYQYFKKELQEYYLELCKNYLLKDYQSRVKQVSITDYEEYDETHVIMYIENLDTNHAVKYIWKDGNSKMHWSNPEVSKDQDGVILNKIDINSYLAEDIELDNVQIEYVEKLAEDYIKL